MHKRIRRRVEYEALPYAEKVIIRVPLWGWVVTVLVCSLGIIIGWCFFVIGTLDSHGPCLERPTRMKRLSQTYRLGCWLGGKEGMPYFYETVQEKSQRLARSARANDSEQAAPPDPTVRIVAPEGSPLSRFEGKMRQ